MDQSCGERYCVSAKQPDIGAPFHEEHVNAVREEPNLHLEFSVDVAKIFQEAVKVPQNLEDTCIFGVVGDPGGWHASMPPRHRARRSTERTCLLIPLASKKKESVRRNHAWCRLGWILMNFL